MSKTVTAIAPATSAATRQSRVTSTVFQITPMRRRSAGLDRGDALVDVERAVVEHVLAAVAEGQDGLLAEQLLLHVDIGDVALVDLHVTRGGGVAQHTHQAGVELGVVEQALVGDDEVAVELAAAGQIG